MFSGGGSLFIAGPNLKVWNPLLLSTIPLKVKRRYKIIMETVITTTTRLKFQRGGGVQNKKKKIFLNVNHKLFETLFVGRQNIIEVKKYLS